MLKLSKQVIYNKIKQCLVSIPSDICRQEAYEINNAVIDAVNWMQNFWTNENAGKKRLLKSGNQWDGREVCEGGAMVEFCQTKMETQSCKYGFIC